MTDESHPQDNKYLQAVRAFADTVLANGRDTFGPKQTPLFADGLHTAQLSPVEWKGPDNEVWILSNLASQQALFRLLDGLSTLTGDKTYRQAAEDAAGYALKHLRSPTGLLYWGGHAAWDLQKEKFVGYTAHEMKGHQPYFALMSRVAPEATRELMESIWAGHVLDWSLLDYNRHANLKLKDAENANGQDIPRPQWDHEFDEDVSIPFPAVGRNLSFCNVTPSLIHSGVMLTLLADSSEAQTWTRRLVCRWQQGKDPDTGLCGGQLSYHKKEWDRAQKALGRMHPEICEAKIVATYHQLSRYHRLPLAQMQAGEKLLGAGNKNAALGQEFIDWAIDDLKIYARQCYDANEGHFFTCMTDGTRLRGAESTDGYYIPDSFAPVKPEGYLLWELGLAYRLSKDTEIWNILREMSRQLDLGDFGRPDGTERQLRLDTDAGDWKILYGVLDIYSATRDSDVLALACRIADNALRLQTASGLFPRPGRQYARTGDELPLALLHLAGAIDSRRSELPQASFDKQFFHYPFHGELEDHQEKRADNRTYDHLVFYGRSY